MKPTLIEHLPACLLTSLIAACGGGSAATTAAYVTTTAAPTTTTTATATTTTNPAVPSGFVTEAQFNQLFPNRASFYTYGGLVAALSAYPEFANTGSDTVRKQETAAFLANVNHESDKLKAINEFNTANYGLYCSTDWGNTCAPGKQYYGRGPLQLSWNYNYKAAGTALGLDLWGDPDLVARDSTVAWKTAIWFWMTSSGAGTMTPHDAMVNSAGFGETIRSINGALECNQADGSLGHTQAQYRVGYYQNFTQILGVAAGDHLGC